MSRSSSGVAARALRTRTAFHCGLLLTVILAALLPKAIAAQQGVFYAIGSAESTPADPEHSRSTSYKDMRWTRQHCKSCAPWASRESGLTEKR